jgi:hypothetical protein
VDEYGARIEDIVVCGPNGPIALNEAPRDLYVVCGIIGRRVAPDASRLPIRVRMTTTSRRFIGVASPVHAA